MSPAQGVREPAVMGGWNQKSQNGFAPISGALTGPAGRLVPLSPQVVFPIG